MGPGKNQVGHKQLKSNGWVNIIDKEIKGEAKALNLHGHCGFNGIIYMDKDITQDEGLKGSLGCSVY